MPRDTKNTPRRAAFSLLWLAAGMCLCFYSFADAATTVPCRSDQCRPSCDCTEVEQTPEICAEDFGAWGWVPPADADDSVYAKMPLEYEIKYDQLKPTGMRGANRKTGIGDGIGTIVDITNDTMQGEVYFEIHPDLWAQTRGDNPSRRIGVELYGGIDIGLANCDEGIILGKELVEMTGVNDKVDNFEYVVEELEDYNELFRRDSVQCHPRSTNGKIGAALFSLREPFYYHDNSASIMNLWYPVKGNRPEGTLLFCIRLKLVEEDQTTIASFLDTKFKIEVTAPTEENNFTRFIEGLSEVNIYSNQPIGPDEDQLLELQGNSTTEDLSDETEDKDEAKKEPEIPTLPRLVIDALLCSSPLETETDGVHNDLRTFRNGQTFRFCVGPSEGYQDQYRVLGFDTVVCNNNGRETKIVNKGVPSLLTIIENEVTGYPLAAGGTVEYDGTISVDAIVSANLSGASFADDANDYFECDGTVFIRDVKAAEEDGDGEMGVRERRKLPTASDRETNSRLLQDDESESSSSPAGDEEGDSDSDSDSDSGSETNATEFESITAVVFDPKHLYMGRFSIQIEHEKDKTAKDKITDVTSGVMNWFSPTTSSETSEGISAGTTTESTLLVWLLLAAGSLRTVWN